MVLYLYLAMIAVVMLAVLALVIVMTISEWQQTRLLLRAVKRLRRMGLCHS